jgi:2-oxoisovalerate dehydrogenase E1 component alpha subunit
MPKNQNKVQIRSIEIAEPETTAQEKLDAKKVYRLMAKSRALEERLIKMTRSGDGYFWIGGPGEEAFGVPLGLLVRKGEGLDYDYLHLHYRSSSILTAMGIEMIDPIRQMAGKATDPYSGGRCFCNHFAIKKWNVMPVTPVIESQYSVAPGTALAQLRHGGEGITIVNGGDAGTAEGDFPTCLNWSSIPCRELPILILVMNNQYGISTHFDQVQGADYQARRAESFGIKWSTVDGNDPVKSYEKLKEVMEYVRKKRKPFCLEAYVSRLYGHSSSSGALRVKTETDCLEQFENRLVREKVFTAAECEAIRKEYADEAIEALRLVRQEPDPTPSSIHDHVYK